MTTRLIALLALVAAAVSGAEPNATAPLRIMPVGSIDEAFAIALPPAAEPARKEADLAPPPKPRKSPTLRRPLRRCPWLRLPVNRPLRSSLLQCLARSRRHLRRPR